MLEVRDVEDDFDAGLTVGRMGGDVADVAFRVPDHSRDVFQHAKSVVTINSQLDGICGRNRIVARPLDINLALGFIEKIRNIWAIERMHSYALATSDVADDTFAANRVTTARAVDQHVSLAANRYGIVVTKNAADYAG